LEAHFRYPQDLFKVQRKILAKYHVTDPSAFYNGEGFWEVPQDPAAKGKRQPPYYQSLRMPGQDSESFSLTTVFNPRNNPQLAAHFRYPQDLFKVQRKILAKYHVTDPSAFYNGEGFWEVPQDPAAKGKRQPPYYQSLRMPGQDSESFSLTTVFNPRNNPQLAAFMAVGSTPGKDYGQIQILQMPRN